MAEHTHWQQQLAALDAAGRRRSLTPLRHEGAHVWYADRRLLNVSSNDYLGVAACADWQRQFLDTLDVSALPLSSSSSRLLTGDFPCYGELEAAMAAACGREACLLFNSGYHANSGLLPALADKHTLIVADKLVHASLIDGMRLAAAQGAVCRRYRHNDLAHLQQILQREAAAFRTVIVVTESVFSMDGDCADLPALAALKQAYPQLLLYVDEAHGIGVYGARGLGLAEATGCLNDIDILVGAFGKALASVGGYVLCSAALKEHLVNRARTLIFSTALPPLNVAWTHFVWQRLPELAAARTRVAAHSRRLRDCLATLGQPTPDAAVETCIVPWILGSDTAAVAKAQALQQRGFYALPIRPPTVPAGSARIRFSLSAAMSDDDVAALCETLTERA
ncbi:8-amino-7-oxononanoate synthase [Neisseria sp. HSC-16F19]|nr:8-amino-7-oxononanoate synthase [Neisseria sp. HSC-16F19]